MLPGLGVGKSITIIAVTNGFILTAMVPDIIDDTARPSSKLNEASLAVLREVRKKLPEDFGEFGAPDSGASALMKLSEAMEEEVARPPQLSAYMPMKQETILCMTMADVHEVMERYLTLGVLIAPSRKKLAAENGNA